MSIIDWIIGKKLTGNAFAGECRRIKNAFLKIKSELNDHRESINGNTNEIQSNYEYMIRLESKMEKLTERLDEMAMFMQHSTVANKFTVSALTTKEQEIFQAMYMSEETTYKEIGRRTGLTENLVICYVTNLMTKGIPIIKRFNGEEVILSIEPDFRQTQAKENILNINEQISQAVMT